MDDTENSKKTLEHLKEYQWKPGESGNPGGRPKNTLKDYVARKFNKMSDEEKEAWLIANKIPADVQWKMAEGNPRQDTELQVTRTMGDVLDELEEDVRPAPEE